MLSRYHRNAAEGPDPIHTAHTGMGNNTTRSSGRRKRPRNGPYQGAKLVHYPDHLTTQPRKTP